MRKILQYVYNHFLYCWRFQGGQMGLGNYLEYIRDAQPNACDTTDKYRHKNIPMYLSAINLLDWSQKKRSPQRMNAANLTW